MKNCPKCDNPEVMYWCNDCEGNSENNECPACGKSLEVDKHYHVNCGIVINTRMTLKTYELLQQLIAQEASYTTPDTEEREQLNEALQELHNLQIV